MPLVRIEVLKGHSEGYKKTFLRVIHKALMDTLSIPDNDRYQRLYEIAPEYFEHSDKSDKFAIIELTLFPGRSKEMKRNVIKEIIHRLGEELGLAPDDIFIIINEPELDNWGLHGEQASELRLNYKAT